VSRAFQPNLNFAAVEAVEPEEAFVVDLDGYEGPLHVLLALARNQKVDLLTLSITRLAEQYLAFVHEARRRNFALAADYLVMASWLAYLKCYERRIRAGEYALALSMSPQEILDMLVRGDTILHKVIVPEGATMARIGALLENAGLMSQPAFLQVAADPDFVANLGLDGNTMEGYLFPETYHFPRGVTAQHVINTMVAQFRSVFSSAWSDRAGEIGFSVHEVVTLASIVEKETGKPEERPVIAGVFLNRLKRNMRLESDPTVIYGMENFDGNITRKDLREPTAYNTYGIKGLPPGPIANPGKEAIKAVLFAPEVDYLYFVSRNDGSHHFSRTLSEHNEMVRKYQLRRH